MFDHIWINNINKMYSQKSRLITKNLIEYLPNIWKSIAASFYVHYNVRRKVNKLAQSYAARIRRVHSIGQPVNQCAVTDCIKNKAQLLFLGEMLPTNSQQPTLSVWITSPEHKLYPDWSPFPTQNKLKDKHVVNSIIPGVQCINTPKYTACQDYGLILQVIFSKIIYEEYVSKIFYKCF